MATHPINDYYVITRRGAHPARWSWEIRRKSKPLGIKITEDGFQSEMAARFAGKRALADFLSDLQREEKRKLGRLSWRPISQCGSTQVARA